MPILALASSAGAADSPEPLVQANHVYRLIIAAVLSLGVILFLRHARFCRIPRTPLDAIGPTPPLVWFFAAVTLYLLSQVLGGQTASLVLGFSPQSADPIGRAAVRAGAFFGWGILLSLAAVWTMRRFARAGAGLPTPSRGLLVGLVGFVLAVPMLVLVGDLAVLTHLLVTGSRPPTIAHETLTLLLEGGTDPRAVVLALSAVVGAPILEETVYRGFLQASLVRGLRSRWAGIVFTSVLFALSHRASPQPVPWHALPQILLVGVACGVLREHPRAGLTAAVAFHAGFNAANVALALLLGSGG